MSLFIPDWLENGTQKITRILAIETVCMRLDRKVEGKISFLVLLLYIKSHIVVVSLKFI